MINRHTTQASATALANCTSAVVVFNRRKDEICDFLRELFVSQSDYSLLCLVKLWIAVKMATGRHPNEEEELLEKLALIEEMILAVFRCDSMDDLDNVLRLLLPSTYAKCDFRDEVRLCKYTNTQPRSLGQIEQSALTCRVVSCPYT